MSNAIAALGPRRESVVVCVQFGARTAADAAGELRSVLATLDTDYIDVLTFYYVEEVAEWLSLIGPGGALEYARAARRDGVIRSLGITSHQRPLAAEIARSGLVDALMIRYNAAHRGAESEVFPVTEPTGMPVIAYTALRWGGLLQPTPDDPREFRAPRAPDWYRFVLQSPSVAVVLAAPANRAELGEDLEVLDASGPLAPADYARLAEHGERVRRHAGRFP
jgi:predicted aldo/keto reductase-like oxidoreductase